MVHSVLSCRCDHDRPGGRHRHFRMVRTIVWLRPPRVMRIIALSDVLCACVLLHIFFGTKPMALQSKIFI